jgi:hypothetical protein
LAWLAVVPSPNTPVLTTPVLGCAVVCCGVVCRYFSHDFETGLLVHTAKGAAMVATTIAAFAYTGYMYIAGTSTPKTDTNPAV